MIWRHLLQTASGKNITEKSIVVCVDLPGYGGSDSFASYNADDVLEALTEFVIGMRALHGSEDEDTGRDLNKTYILGHDWGCLLAYRLAAEAPALADRFILTNGPHIELALSNKDRTISSAAKIFRQFRQSPRANFACLPKTYHALKPLLSQVFLFGYIAVFQLPTIMVKYLGTGGKLSFVRGANSIAYGRERKEYNVEDSLATTFGPGTPETKSWTQTPLGKKSETYGPSVLSRCEDLGEAFMNLTAYYRDGAAFASWNKSLQTTADLFNIEQNQPNGAFIRRRSSSASSVMFGDLYKGSLHVSKPISQNYVSVLDASPRFLP